MGTEPKSLLQSLMLEHVGGLKQELENKTGFLEAQLRQQTEENRVQQEHRLFKVDPDKKCLVSLHLNPYSRAPVDDPDKPASKPRALSLQSVFGSTCKSSTRQKLAKWLEENPNGCIRVCYEKQGSDLPTIEIIDKPSELESLPVNLPIEFIPGFDIDYPKHTFDPWSSAETPPLRRKKTTSPVVRKLQRKARRNNRSKK